MIISDKVFLSKVFRIMVDRRVIDMTIKEMACKLKEIREKKGISSLDMSKAIGNDENYMDKVEEGKIVPSCTDLAKICHYLHITLDSLFNEENDKTVLLDSIHNELEKYDIEKLLKIYYMIKE